MWVVDYDTFVAKVGGGGGVKFETTNELATKIEKGEEIFSWKKNHNSISPLSSIWTPSWFLTFLIKNNVVHFTLVNKVLSYYLLWACDV